MTNKDTVTVDDVMALTDLDARTAKAFLIRHGARIRAAMDTAGEAEIIEACDDFTEEERESARDGYWDDKLHTERDGD